LTMVIALANMANRINDALQIEPDLGWTHRDLYVFINNILVIRKPESEVICYNAWEFSASD
jgi:hypothetical protein